jgi:Spy/CpxP family protein refolding chaperone
MPGAKQKEQIMKRIHTIIAGTAGTLALVAAAAFAAAPEAGFGPCGGPGGAGRGHGPMGMMQGSGPGVHGGMWGGGWGFMSGQNLEALKSQLAITAKQEPAWSAFAAKAAEQASLMQSMREQHWQGVGADTTPQARMAQHIGLMTQHLTRMQAINGAMTDLYAVLTPEQRSTADRLLSHMGPGGYGPDMMGRGR